MQEEKKIEQGLLFPELDPFSTKIKDIDYVDIREVDEKYSSLPEGKFILFKSGGRNQYMEKEGDSFPYVQNTVNKLITVVRGGDYDAYPKFTIHSDNKSFNIRMHRIVAKAFVENDMPDKKIWVDHKDGNYLDYRVQNLRWVTPSENAKNGKEKNRQISFLEKQRILKKNDN